MSADGARYYIAQASMAATTGWTGIAAAVGVVPAAIGAAAAGAVAGAVALERRRRNRNASRTGTSGARSGRPTGRSRLGRALNRMRGRPTGKPTGRPTGSNRPTGKKPTGKSTGRPTGTGAKKPTGRPTGTGGKSTASKNKKTTGTGSKPTKGSTGTGAKKSTDNKKPTASTNNTKQDNETTKGTPMSQRMTYQAGLMTETAASIHAAVGAIPWTEDAAGIINGVAVINDLHGALNVLSQTIRSIADGLDRPGLDPRIATSLQEIAGNQAIAANEAETTVRAIRVLHAEDFERMEADVTNALDRRTNLDNL